MREAVTSRKLAAELKVIRKDLDYLKEHMVDIDAIMTEDDYLVLGEYRREKKRGKLTFHEELKEELGV